MLQIASHNLQSAELWQKKNFSIGSRMAEIAAVAPCRNSDQELPVRSPYPGLIGIHRYLICLKDLETRSGTYLISRIWEHNLVLT